MLVLVLLGIVWIVALTPVILRKFRERETLSSVTSFTSQLWKLSGGGAETDSAASVSGAEIGFSAATRRLVRFDAGCASDDADPANPPIDPLSKPIVSRTTTMRRRRVIVALVALTLIAFAVGLAVHVFLYLGVVAFVLMLGYFGLLAYFHHAAVERAQKVVALETRREVALALDEARNHCVRPVSHSPRTLRGSGWSVQGYQLDDADLAAAGR